MTRVQHTRRMTHVQHTMCDSRAVSPLARAAHEYRLRAVHGIMHACGPLRVTCVSDVCDTTKIEEYTRVQHTRVST